MNAHSLWIIFLGCAQPGDCLYFEDCEIYQPQGLACGLAGHLVDHIGGSCKNGYDPATIQPSSALVTAGAYSVACPQGYLAKLFVDHGSTGNYGWNTCVALGNATTSSGQLRDLPNGAVCGLSDMEYDNAGCEGYNSRNGECPPGYRFNWVIDRFADRTNGQCQDDPDATIQPYQGRILTFCEVIDGCNGADCPSYLTPDSRRGQLCGLHSRDGYMDSNPVLDREKFLEQWIEPCSPYYEDFARLLPYLKESLEDPTCMGKSLIDGECPVGMALICTSDWVSDYEGEWGFPAISNSICWCDIEGQAQHLPE